MSIDRTELQQLLSGLYAHDSEIHRQIEACKILLQASSHTAKTDTPSPAAPAKRETTDAFVGKVRLLLKKKGKPDNMGNAVLQAMKEGTTSIGDLKKIGNPKTVSSAMGRLKAAGLIRNKSYGQWALTKKAAK